MANKYPYMQLYVNDYLTDTAILSLSAKGLWVDLILTMHQRGCGEIAGTTTQLSRLCRCTVDELVKNLKELSDTGVADVSGLDFDQKKVVTEMLQTCYDIVTVSCRRLKRAESERERAKAGMQKTRELRKRYEDVTEPLQESYGVYISESESEYINKKNIIAPTHTHARDTRDESKSDSIPDMSKFETVDAILEIAASAHCGIACTREQAETYLADRMAGDWFDPMRRKIKPGRVAADLKNFLIRQEQKKNKPQFTQKKGMGIYADGKHLVSDPGDYGKADNF